MADFIENLASSDTVSLFTLAYVDPAKVNIVPNLLEIRWGS
jgi:hypothetical protein